MTAVQVQGPTLALDPATRSTLLQTIVDSLPHIPNASEAERTALREAAFALVEKLAPTDPVEAIIAAQVIAAHYACVNAYRCAARSDLPSYDLHLRYQTKAGSLSRLTTAKLRELVRHQAAQPTLPAAIGAARAAQAQATAPSVPARPATPAPRADEAAAGQRPGSAVPAAAPRGREASPDHAAIDLLLAKAAAASDPADDDFAPPTDAEFAQIVANAHALLAETAPPAEDMAERLQAEVAARAAAAATARAA
jgi:hypothetical protein